MSRRHGLIEVSGRLIAWLLALGIAWTSLAGTGLPGTTARAQDPAAGMPDAVVEEKESSTSGRAGPAAPAELPSSDAPATLIVWDRPLAVFRVAYGGNSPQQRARAAAIRIEAMLGELTPDSIRFSPAQIGSQRGIVVEGGAHVLFGLLLADLPQDGADTLDRAGAQSVQRLQQLLTDRSEQRSARELLWEVLKVSVATVIAFGLWQVLRRVSGNVIGRLQRLAGPRTRALEQIGLFIRPLILRALTWVVRLASLGLTLAITYVWLVSVLSSFPLTRPWGAKLGSYLVDTLGQFALSAAAQIPDLIALVLILFITRAVARLIDTWFTSVEEGSFSVSWLSPDAARVARRLVIIGIWVFALTVAYPYIPGSQTNVFKGATVFVGLMVSLASQGILNQVFSGLLVVHTGALRRGDHVRIGEVVGTVVEVGMVATRINTIVQEEVTVPNSVIVTTSVSNYSRGAPPGGAVISTGVTVGFDAPWRQVHALLEQAASRTPGIRTSPKPFVLQSALSDFYVEYRLCFHIDRADDRPFVVSRLHSEIQDAFNAAGVQLMSPHFMVQPDQSVTVPPSKWFPAAAMKEPDAQPGLSS